MKNSILIAGTKPFLSLMGILLAGSFASGDAMARVPLNSAPFCTNQMRTLENVFQVRIDRSPTYTPSSFLSSPPVHVFQIRCPAYWSQFKLKIADIYAAAHQSNPASSHAQGEPNYGQHSDGHPPTTPSRPGSGGTAPAN